MNYLKILHIHQKKKIVINLNIKTEKKVIINININKEQADYDALEKEFEDILKR